MFGNAAIYVVLFVFIVPVYRPWLIVEVIVEVIEAIVV